MVQVWRDLGVAVDKGLSMKFSQTFYLMHIIVVVHRSLKHIRKESAAAAVSKRFCACSLSFLMLEIRECLSTVSCTVASCESAYFGGLSLGNPTGKLRASKRF